MNRIPFSRTFQFPSANPSTFLVKTLSDTRSPRSTELLKTLAPLLFPPPRFHSFYSFGSPQATDNRTCREDAALIDPRPFVTTTAGKWSPFTCRAGKNLASLSATCLLFTPRETLSILSPFQREEGEEKSSTCFFFQTRKFSKTRPDRLIG